MALLATGNIFKMRNIKTFLLIGFYITTKCITCDGNNFEKYEIKWYSKTYLAAHIASTCAGWFCSGVLKTIWLTQKIFLCWYVRCFNTDSYSQYVLNVWFTKVIWCIMYKGTSRKLKIYAYLTSCLWITTWHNYYNLLPLWHIKFVRGKYTRAKNLYWINCLWMKVVLPSKILAVVFFSNIYL